MNWPRRSRWWRRKPALRIDPLLVRELVIDHDLLPGFAREARRQIFDLIHRAQHHRIVVMLNVERGDLADERGHLAAIIKVAREFETGHRPARRGGGARAA